MANDILTYLQQVVTTGGNLQSADIANIKYILSEGK